MAVDLSTIPLESLWRLFPDTYAAKCSNGTWIPYRHLKFVLRRVAKGIMRPEGGYQALINLPASYGKSQAISCWLSTWFMDTFPNKQEILTGYSGEHVNVFARQVRDTIKDNEKVNVKLKNTVGKATDFETTRGGKFWAQGIGGALTGHHFDLGIIDDPIKEWDEAISENFREGIKNWYHSVFYKRRKPRASIIIIMCMTGDTPVLMADGSEHSLRNLKIGDRIATYEDGHITVSTVRNWKNQGFDFTYEIKTSSGITVKSNKRHPFLVCRNGYSEWERLKNLKAGDKLVRVSLGENGAECSAPLMGVRNQLVVKDSAHHTTTKKCVKLVRFENPVQKRIEHEGCEIGMELNQKILMPLLKSKAENALFAANHRHKATAALTGPTNSALTTITPQGKCEDCCATVAILLSDMARPRESYFWPLSTYKSTLDEIVSIKPIGYKEVFDIQVDRTGNFIANGLVSHNTRWHEDDLSGYLMAKEPDDWDVISLPAIATRGDLMGRAQGEVLCPELYPKEHVYAVKEKTPTLIWDALDQQQPSALAGNVIKRNWWKYWDVLPTHLDEIIAAADLNLFKDKKLKNDRTSYGVLGRRGANIYVLHVFRDILDFDEQVPQFHNLVKRYPMMGAKLVENKANGYAMERTLRTTIPGIILREPHGGKLARVLGVLDMWKAGNIWIPRDDVKYPWVKDYVNECSNFPQGRYDDQVDMTSLALVYFKEQIQGGLTFYTHENMKKALQHLQTAD